MRISPTEKFTDTVFPNYINLTRAYTFGCLVYILDPRLQDSKKVLKWSMRSKREIYLGVISKQHTSTVQLILNPETSVISPQYHCVCDDTFSTVWFDGLFDQHLWEHLVQQADCHFSIEPSNSGQVTLPNEFISFAPDTPASDSYYSQTPTIQQPPTQVNPINPGTIVQTPPTSILNKHIFHPQTSAPPPPPVLPTVPPTVF